MLHFVRITTPILSSLLYGSSLVFPSFYCDLGILSFSINSISSQLVFICSMWIVKIPEWQEWCLDFTTISNLTHYSQHQFFANRHYFPEFFTFLLLARYWFQIKTYHKQKILANHFLVKLEIEVLKVTIKSRESITAGFKIELINS